MSSVNLISRSNSSVRIPEIQNLPDEITLKIFKLVAKEKESDLCPLRSVCRSWRESSALLITSLKPNSLDQTFGISLPNLKVIHLNYNSLINLTSYYPESISSLKNLREIYINKISIDGISFLAKYINNIELTRLSVTYPETLESRYDIKTEQNKYCKVWTAEIMNYLPMVTHVKFPGRLEDSLLSHIGKMKNLQSLEVDLAEKCDGHFLSRLEVSNLLALHLKIDAPNTMKFFRRIFDFTLLQKLSMDSSTFVGKGIEMKDFSTLINLRELHLSACHYFSSFNIESWTKLSQLTLLNFYTENISFKPGELDFRSTPYLQKIDLSYEDLQTHSTYYPELSSIFELADLRSLKMYGEDFSQCSFINCTKFSKLEALEFSMVRLNTDEFNSIAKLTTLTHLSLVNFEHYDRDSRFEYNRLSSLRNLQYIEIDYTDNISASDLTGFTNLTKITDFNFTETPIEEHECVSIFGYQIFVPIKIKAK